MSEAFKPDLLEIDEILIVDGVEQSAGIYEWHDEDSAPICRAPIGYARLFAASPDMLGAARNAAMAIGDWSMPTGANGMTTPRRDHPLISAMHQLYAAIAKAEGKDQ